MEISDIVISRIWLIDLHFKDKHNYNAGFRDFSQIFAANPCCARFFVFRDLATLDGNQVVSVIDRLYLFIYPHIIMRIYIYIHTSNNVHNCAIFCYIYIKFNIFIYNYYKINLLNATLSVPLTLSQSECINIRTQNV